MVNLFGLLIEQINDNNAPETDAPETTTVDSELEREIWSAPRPELTNIHLDETRTAQVKPLHHILEMLLFN